MQNLLKDLLWIIFPTYCQSCSQPLNAGEQVICSRCLFELPVTGNHLEQNNQVIKRFWGKVPVVNAVAYMHYKKGNKAQQLIYQLKYKGRKEVGFTIGKLYGRELKQLAVFNSADLIIPVPLHKKKMRKRGFNQSELFAKGLSAVMNIPVNLDAIVRKKPTESQTKKNRFNRFINVDKVFELVDHDAVQGKHILLVDDVVTTGSTLTACAEQLLKAKGTRVSIAAIACADS